jgi:hypothetical protein
VIEMKDLEEFERYLTSGRLAGDFEIGNQDEKFALLEFLEKFMDLAELVDKEATGLIFKAGYLELLAGVKTQK